MNRWSILLLAFVPLAAPAAAEVGKWDRIFDGKTLDGWTPKITGRDVGDNYLDTFQVRHGAIRVSYDRYDGFGGHFGHLAYRRPLSAFRIRFDYRFYGKDAKGIEDWQYSNSGLMILGQAPETMARDQKFPVSAEVQLLGAERPEPQPTANVCSPGTDILLNGTVAKDHCNLSSAPIIPDGRWVHVEVEVTKDGQVTHFVDGEPVMHYSGVRYDPTDEDAKPLISAAGGALDIHSGYIYLQSEGHPIEFKNIELMELD